jgi:hypothetical protein
MATLAASIRVLRIAARKCDGMAVVIDRPLPPVGTIPLPEAARILGAHRTVVNKYVLNATLPGVNVLGRWYVWPEDVRN